MAHLTAGQSPFRGLDRAAELPALADADDLVFGDLAVYQFVEDGADTNRVDTYLIQ
ncbi:hypothetical protein D3C75_1269590 [compost metagenome]